MAGTVAFWLPLIGDADGFAERFTGDPGGWLPPPGEPRGPGHWAVELHAGPVTRTVTCMVGEPSGDEHLSRHLVWQADPEPGDGPVERALPSFDGRLVLRRTGGGAELRFEGRWRGPDGTIGAALSPAQAQVLAQTAAERFLQQVAQHLAGDRQDGER